MLARNKGNLVFEGPMYLNKYSSEFDFVERHRKRWSFGIKYKHIPKLYPWLFSVLSGIKISTQPEAKAETKSGVFSSRHKTEKKDAVVLILEETRSSPLSDSGACVTTIVLIIEKHHPVHMSAIDLEYENKMLHHISFSPRVAIDYCENYMSPKFVWRDPYNTLATVALSLGVYLSDVKQSCLKKLTDVKAGNLEQTHKHNVGDITVGDLVSAGMARWGSSRVHNDIAKCCFVLDRGQLRIVEEHTKPRNKHKVAKLNIERVPLG